MTQKDSTHFFMMGLSVDVFHGLSFVHYYYFYHFNVYSASLKCQPQCFLPLCVLLVVVTMNLLCCMMFYGFSKHLVFYTESIKDALQIK